MGDEGGFSGAGGHKVYESGGEFTFVCCFLSLIYLFSVQPLSGH